MSGLYPRVLCVSLLIWVSVEPVAGADGPLNDLVREVDPRAMTSAQREQHVGMIQRDIRRRRDDANAKNRLQWRAMESRADWEAYRDTRLQRLRASLGTFPRPSKTLKWATTNVVEGDGFRIRNVVYESRPRVWVAGNLYVPDAAWYQPLPESMPGVIIVHSHHRDKTHGELQDMGMTWARAGCQVLIIDQVGYGERRAHPFHTQEDFDGSFKSWRQDYYFRYDSGAQLRLVGDSLMGWFVWDLMRGVDLLLQQPHIDPSRIVILGSVAGGGDPCAVTAALDNRIAGAVPFNFGGLQPESYPLPENVEETFNFAMSSYWDSTRGLPRTCADGFFHWTIAASIAPRPLIYAHEFMWDRQRDPVWKRFQKIYGDFYEQPDHLAFAVGQGSVRDNADVATHCTHIGRHHRTYIHPAFDKWFDIQVEEYSRRVDKSQLICMTPELRDRNRPVTLPQTIHDLAAKRVEKAREQRSVEGDPRRKLQVQLESLVSVELGDPRVLSEEESSSKSFSITRTVLEIEENIVVPLLLLRPTGTTAIKPPVVVAVSQSGKAAFLRERTKVIARLLESQCAVCLVDVRGVGETREGAEPARRGRTSRDVGLSVNMEMFGESILGQRLRDLRSVLRHLRQRSDVDGSRIALWGDSLIAPNPSGPLRVEPHGVSRSARSPEPAGGVLALLAGLFEEELKGVAVHQGLGSYLSAYTSAVMHLPHDAVIPQMLNVADLPDVAAALRAPLRMSAMVDAQNQLIPQDELRALHQHLPPKQQARTQLLGPESEADQSLADWLVARLK